MVTLYSLSAELMALLEMAEDPDVDAQALKDTMDAVEGEFEIKAEGCAKVNKQLELQAELIDVEIKRLTKRKQAMKNNAARIKTYLEQAMIATGKTKFKTELFSFGIQKNPAKLVLADDIDFEKVPAEFLVFNDPSIDKDSVKDAIKKGADFEWAQLVQEESLRIR